jgi:hypothetical protein
MWKASLSLGEAGFVKDYSANGFLPRYWGRLCLRWEEAALAKLDGVVGVPAFRGRPTRDSLCLEAVPGVPLASLGPGDVGEIFIERLKVLFAQVHARGVAHGDAHQRNILVHEDTPYLIDFSTAYVRGRLPVLDGYLFSCFVLLDQERLYKVEKRFFGRGTPPRMFLLYRIAKGWKQWRRR